ncbi:precorrin-2 C(20)-methyltransferase [Lichenicoccus sp.]|uniref:precorrin-2 C(20)-methyltransferase n=1 Tax=Lichenicoccus sp. TaxID=2781899 RepID=UPI003D10354F
MSGTLHVVGMGPGDPELLTLKALRLIEAAPVVAYFAKRGRTGHARRIAGDRIDPRAELLRFEYPFTTELSVADPRYLAEIGIFYEASAARLAERLALGRDVALLCEGDPFFYGSAMYLFDRLHREFPFEIVPGVTGMSGCWSAAGVPFTHGDDVLLVLPGTLDRQTLAARLAIGDAAVIMKVGSNLAKIQAALDDAGLLSRAIYVESGMMPGQRIMPLAEMAGQAAPYFSMVLVPGRRRAR